MVVRKIALFLIPVFATPAIPAMAEPLALEPMKQWVLNEYDDKCRVSRTFGAGEDEVTLWIDKGGPGPSINITLIGKPMRNPFGPRVRLAFEPGEAIERNYIKLTSSKGRPVLAMFGIEPVSLAPPVQYDDAAPKPGAETVEYSNGLPAGEAEQREAEERLKAIYSLDLSGALEKPVSLPMEGLHQSLMDLLDCTERFVHRVQTTVTSPTKPRDMEEWSAKVSANYPVYLLSREQEGSVSVRLTINKTGRASFCEVTKYSGPASFNDTACLQLLTHARFDPATDKDGNAAASFYSTTVVYSIRK